MIRKVLLSTVAIAAVSGTAFAADLPSRRAPPVYIPPPIPVFSWTGFYVGGDIGYAFGRDRATEYPNGPTFNVGQHDGLIGGGHVGYNFSTQSFPLLGGLATGVGGGLGGLGFGGGSTGGVIGVEGDVTGSDYRGTAAFAGLTESTRSDIQGSIRGRIGVAVDRALFFATGGAAFAEFVNNYEFNNGFISSNNDRIGWTVGGGVEYAITTAWSLRAEYRYSDFGSYYNSTAIPVTLNTRHNDILQRATIGFSYKFESPMAAPVVARY